MPLRHTWCNHGRHRIALGLADDSTSFSDTQLIYDRINVMRFIQHVFVFITMSLFANPANSAVVSGLLPGQNGQNSVSVLFSDSRESATLILEGKVAFTENIPTYSLQTTDLFWIGTITLNIDEFVDDEISLSVTLYHAVKLHAEDSPTGATFSDTFSILAENYDDGDHEIKHADKKLLHSPHYDLFYNNKFTFSKTTDLGILDYDEIGTWNYTLNAVHTPEPTSIAIFGLGILSYVPSLLRRRKKSVFCMSKRG